MADRNFAAGDLLARVVKAKAHLFVRAKTGAGGPKLPVLTRHRDGSYTSRFGGVPVRVVEAEITAATVAGRVTGVYRLITILLDPHATGLPARGRVPARRPVPQYQPRSGAAQRGVLRAGRRACPYQMGDAARTRLTR